MSYDEPLVGSIAIAIALISVVIAVGPWQEPYQLSTFSAISNRFGKTAARWAWVLVALALLTSGLAILTDLRPGYAHPALRSSLDQE